MKIPPLLALLLLGTPVISQAEVFSQQGPVPQLVELYTSEGCSSCPPADRYMATLLNSPQLWKTVIPVAFHVDYWDYIGWKDPFAQRQFSNRQRTHQITGAVRSIYTPGWVVDGREWRGFFSRRPLPKQSSRQGGTLKVTVNGNAVSVSYSDSATTGKVLTAHLAELAFDQASNIKAGENRGLKLKHQFVARSLQTAEGQDSWQFRLPTADKSSKRAIAVWLTHGSNSMPLQATGGWLSPSS